MCIRDSPRYIVYKENPEKVDGDDPKPMNPLVLWPVGCTSALWFNKGMGPKIQGFISGLFSTMCIDRLCQRESMMVTLSPDLKHQCTMKKTQQI